MYDRIMEKFGIIFSLLQPLVHGLLFAEYFLLPLLGLQLTEQVFLPIFHALIPSIFHCFLMDKLNIVYQPLFIFKNVPKVFFIPRADFGLKSLKILFKVIHHYTRMGD